MFLCPRLRMASGSAAARHIQAVGSQRGVSEQAGHCDINNAPTPEPQSAPCALQVKQRKLEGGEACSIVSLDKCSMEQVGRG